MFPADPDKYPLPYFYRDDDCDPSDLFRWTARDYTLNVALDVEDNDQATQLVVSSLTEVAPEVVQRLVFDSERGCFFAYGNLDSDLEMLRDVVASLVAEHHPHAIPGDMLCSPAAIRRWQLPEV